MHCAEFESRLNDVLDERLWLDSDPALTAHVQHCRPCRELAASYEAMVTGLEQSKIPATSPGLTAGVLAALPTLCAEWDDPDVIRGEFGKSRPATQTTIGRRRSAWRRRALVGMAAAAAMLGAVALRWNTADRDIGPAAVAPGSIAVRPNASPGKVPVGAAPALGGNLAADAGNSLTAAIRLFPGSGSADASPSGANVAEKTSWVHDVSDGLKPVTSTTASAVTSFFELLAGDDEGARS